MIQPPWRRRSTVFVHFLNALRLTAAIVLLASVCRAQTDAGQVADPMYEDGMKPYGSFSGGQIDSVNFLNTKLNLRIPLVSFPQRGSTLHLGFSIIYVNTIYNFVYDGPNCNPDRTNTCNVDWAPTQGGIYIVTDGIPFVYNSNVQGQNVIPGEPAFSLQLPDMTTHPLIALASNSNSYVAVDGSGYSFVTQSNGSIVFDKFGNRFNNSSASCSNTYNCIQPTSIEDPNGNLITSNLGSPNGGADVLESWTDTLGRTIPAPPVPGAPSFGQTSNFSGCTGALPTTSAYLWTVPGPSGGTSTYKVCMTGIYINLENCSGRCTDIAGPYPRIQSIVLPNNTAWTFQYDSANPNSSTSYGYGDLTQITFPTGGSISYTWHNIQFDVCTNPTPYGRGLVTRTTSPNANQNFTSAYTQVVSSSQFGPIATTEQDPLGNQTVHSFTALQNTCSYYETEVQYYQGSASSGTLLKTDSTQYNANVWDSGAIPDTALPTINVVPTSETTSWANGMVSQEQRGYAYDVPLSANGLSATYGNVTSLTEYDYGNGSPGGLLRKTNTSYQYQNASSYQSNNLVSLPATVSTYDGSGTLRASTSYGYDATSPISSGISTQHSSAPPDGSTRGNLTSIGRWLNTTGAYLTTTNAFFDTGMLQETKDPNGNTTTFAYSSAYIGAFPTTVTNALSQSTTHAYDFNTGLLMSTTDANNQTTSFTYDDMWRIASIFYPDKGNIAITRQETSFPFTASSTQIATPSPSIVKTNIFDGFGRLTQAQIQTSESGCATVFTNTTYDALGRVATLSNPFCNTSDPTYGVTTYAYDPLNRTTQVTHADGSEIVTAYTGRATEVTDEGNGTKGVQRISQVDGLGRLVSVCEVTNATQMGTSGTPVNCGQDIAATGFPTVYTYDALDNLLSVSQSGLNARSFTYDSLSRLTQAVNPESGTINYSYDADGNMISKTSPAPNQTGSGTVTTTYAYDALNRLTQKNYSDGTTPQANYTYDLNNVWSTTETNTIGRLVWISTGPTAPHPTGSVFSYDSMGRVLNSWQCTPYNCGTGAFGLPYTYDLAGDILTYGNGANITFTQTFNAAAQLTQLTSSYSNSENPGTLFSNAVYNAPGQLTSDMLGNGITETRAYNSRLWMTSFSAGSAYSLSMSSYAPNGDVLAVSDSANGSWNYAYDDFNRLCASNQVGQVSLTCSSSNNTGQQAYTYAYDRFGNRWKQTLTGGIGSTSNLTFSGNNNHIDGYTYDAAGNVLNDGVHSYTYDAENRIISVDGGSTASYVYDAEGRRVEKATATLTLDYVYDLEGNAIALFNKANGGWWWGEVFAGGRHLATYYNNTTYFDHVDWLGTERVRTTIIGAVCETITSLPFGDGQTTTGSCADYSPHHFTGKERDSESGLDNFGARYNSSQFGRFMSPDPLLNSGHPNNPQTWNRYTYALNNPLNVIDPTGLYDLTNHCAKDDKKCNKQFEQDAKDLKNGLANLQKRVDELKDGPEKQRLQAVLTALGTEGDHNGVNVSFGTTRDGAAGQTDPVYNGEGAKETYNVTLDPTKISDQNFYAIDAAHEGTHISDVESELANPEGQPVLSDFSYEYRGYQTSAFAAQALGLPNLSVGGNMIWNESWQAADQQTLMDKGITQIVTGPPYNDQETKPHNPWPN